MERHSTDARGVFGLRQRRSLLAGRDRRGVGIGDKTAKLWDAQSGQERQTLQVRASIRELCFTSDGNCLLTDRGVLNVISSASMSVQARPALCPRLFVKEQWVTLGSENLLWLLPDYRASCVAVQGRTVVLGHPSGRVSMLKFFV